MIDCRDLVGVPYKRGGRSLDGFDCLGLCLYMLSRRGVEVPSFPGLHEARDNDNVTLEMVRSGISATKVESADEGCILDMRCMGKHHIGYCVGNGMFIHASESSGMVVMDRVDRWRSRIMGVYCVED